MHSFRHSRVFPPELWRKGEGIGGKVKLNSILSTTPMFEHYRNLGRTRYIYKDFGDDDIYESTDDNISRVTVRVDADFQDMQVGIKGGYSLNSDSDKLYGFGTLDHENFSNYSEYNFGVNGSYKF